MAQKFEDEFKSLCANFCSPIGIKVNKEDYLMKGRDKPILRVIFGVKLVKNSIPGMKLIKET